MEVNKLNNLAQGLEKSINSTLVHLKKYDDYQEIIDLIAELDKERNKSRDSVLATLKGTVCLVKDKSELLKHKRILEIKNLRQFKAQMILIQENIKNLKVESKTKLRQLKEEYFDLAEDLDYYTEKIPVWSEIVRDPFHTELSKKSVTSGGPKCKEVRDFIEFVHKSKGHENGWRREDHQLFLRLRQKHKDINIVAKYLHETLPDISIDEIECHEKWYKEYLLLHRNKRKAIREWKSDKNSAKIRNDSNSSISSQNQLNTDKATKPQEYESIKKMLTDWKLEKQQKIQNAILIDKMKEQKRKEIAAEQKKQHEELKQLVEMWKKSKTEMEVQELMQKREMEEREKRRRAAEANKMIKQFQVQDDLYILKKQAKKREEVKPFRSQSSQLAKRDPTRLLKPTQQWINRVHDENDYLAESLALSLRNVQKLGIPEWRRKID